MPTKTYHQERVLSSTFGLTLEQIRSLTKEQKEATYKNQIPVFTVEQIRTLTKEQQEDFAIDPKFIAKAMRLSKEEEQLELVKKISLEKEKQSDVEQEEFEESPIVSSQVIKPESEIKLVTKEEILKQGVRPKGSTIIPKRDTDQQTDAEQCQLNYQHLANLKPTETYESNSQLQTPVVYAQLDIDALTSGMKNRAPVASLNPTKTQKEKDQHVRAVKNSKAIELYLEEQEQMDSEQHQNDKVEVDKAYELGLTPEQPEQEQINELRTQKFLLWYQSDQAMIISRIEKFKKNIIILEQRKINKFLNSLIKLFTIGIINYNNKIEKKISNYNKKIEKQINMSNKKSNIELINAAITGNIRKIQYLLAKGANVNYQNPDGVTALMYSVSFGHLEIVKFLVENGAKIHLQDEFSFTALTWAAKNGHKIIEEYLKSYVLDSNKNDEAIARTLQEEFTAELNSEQEELDREVVNAIGSQQTQPNTQSRKLQL